MIYQIRWFYLCMDEAKSPWNGAAFPPDTPDGFIKTGVSKRAALAEFIKCPESDDDTFIFIIPKHEGTLLGFEKWLKDSSLEEYVAFRTEGITNPMHPDRPKNLFLFIVQSPKHYARVSPRPVLVEAEFEKEAQCL